MSRRVLVLFKVYGSTAGLASAVLPHVLRQVKGRANARLGMVTGPG